MEFDLNKASEILERTPKVLHTLLSGLSNEWIASNEGPGTWAPLEVLGHLINGEKHLWIVRADIILSDNENKRFIQFDRFSHLVSYKDKTVQELLIEFSQCRQNNIKELHKRNLKFEDYSRTGIHPEFGKVTLGQLLAMWAVHDMTHINQIIRVMARQYEEAVGPWSAYASIFKR